MMIAGLTLLISVGLIPAHFNYHCAIAQKCDQSLWRHIFQWKRLTVIDICKTVSGTIVDRTLQASSNGEGDGDIHVRVKLDPQFTNILTPSNYAQQDGYLVVEPIVKRPQHTHLWYLFAKTFIKILLSHLTVPMYLLLDHMS